MSTTEIGDPRLQALFGSDGRDDGGVRPTMRLPRRGMSSAAIAIGAVLMALLLFAVLNAQRTQRPEPADRAPAGTPAIQFDVPPPLYIPPAPAPVAVTPSVEQKMPAPLPAAPVMRAVPAAQPQIVHAPQPMQQFAPPQAPVIQPRTSAGSALVMDSSAAVVADGSPTAASGPLAATSSGLPAGRMRAGVFANRSATVPQGYLIPAVLETGFDSTRPGFARAVVTRDVRGFDGSVILIPRGSRLIGEYRSDVSQGQKRVAIIWTRLLRPDGMTIGLDSPAVDTVGRGGVAASVNTHFFRRLGDALLQSTFEVGRVLAGRAVRDPVIVVSGNSATAAAGPIMSATNYAPTLKIPAGRSISVFVAHDLDFSAAGVGR